ncbi:serine-rich adhesin for platelets [Condylostylus longicornis]|uniref:serine-rich adhesin for platelets n=1 Tax=Condylostylus longicornis TaxID=2530218 RepID=UPI00244DE94B|nr:serine-rich adhesin for platelets [Condylostylus longicornis]XP_055390378.1 serine-rich adhesin for platelets [Condylostylus longicornis]XP_055390379.1 serine-rich adhesin for platelets [Condylostylus longicornis]
MVFLKNGWNGGQKTITSVMGLRPKILDHNILNREHINDMDNELEKRLHNLEKSTNFINKKNTNKIFNKMLFIKNYLNNRFLRKFLQKHHYNHNNNNNYHCSYNTNINYHKIILQILLMTFLIFMLRITTINCLPVTSKPIENTPEHLAWEAWIMLPPPANSERHRKIMPKSIFVLPTNINNKNSHNLPVPQPQIQCPPGYRVDNSKCIPTISINRDQLLIDQLSNLLPVSMKPEDSSYDDYDYDYTNGDTINYDLDMLQTYNKQQSPPLINNNPNTFRVTEKDSEPLKINFSLDKFSIAKDENQNNNKNSNLSSSPGIKNDSNEYIMEINHEENSEKIKLRPFRDQETSSSTIKLSTTTTSDATNKENQSESTSAEIGTSETDTEGKDENDTESILQQQYSTIFGRKESTTISTTSTGSTETVSESNNSSTNTDTTEFNENHQTESKRESTTTSITIDTTTTNFTENAKYIDHTTNRNNKNTEIPLDLSEFPNSNQNDNVFVTTVSSTDSSTMVAILSSDENEMSSVSQNTNDLNSTTTSDYEYDQTTTLNNNNKNHNEYVEVITEQMEKEKNLIEKLSEESLVLDKSLEENTSTDISSEISLGQDEMTTNPPMYDDLSSEIVDSSSSPLKIYNNIEKSSTESSISLTTTTEGIKKLNKTTEKNVEKLEHKIVHVDRHRLHHKYHGIPQSTVSISASQPIEWHEDREPLMESIESNNRFVYHHLGSSPAPQSNSDIKSTQYISPSENTKSNIDLMTGIPTPKPTVQPKRDTQADINEQLRIINMIVEENKRRAQASKIRFPEDQPPTSTQNPLRSHTLVRFPNESHQESTPYHIATSYYQPQNGRFDPEKLIFHRRFFQHQQQHSTTQTPSETTSSLSSIVTTTTSPDTQKPFWWLPSGWEIDQNGERPMLIRFWSRSPSRNSEQFTSNTEPYIQDQYRTAASNTQHIVADNLRQRNDEKYNINYNKNINYNINTSDGLYSQQSLPAATATTTTTSRYRANSRSPTDNLYHEVPSSQNVYKVLNAARQWKNSKR